MTEKTSGEARSPEMQKDRTPENQTPKDRPAATADETASGAKSKEVGGRDGLDPTRFGDWEKNGRCIDF